MKIKHIFEESDFKGSGQMLIRNSYHQGSENYTFGVTVSYKVGYTWIVNKQVVLLISLADGMSTVFLTKEDLCKKLNEDHLGYRPMTKEEIEKILGEQGNRFE